MNQHFESTDSILDELASSLIAEFVAAASRLSLITQADVDAARAGASLKLHAILAHLEGQQAAAAKGLEIRDGRARHSDIPGFIRKIVEDQRSVKE
jgi:hypothetical protein